MLSEIVLLRRFRRWASVVPGLQQDVRSLSHEHLIDSYRELGEVLTRQRRCDEAIRAYERSLKVAFAGR